MELIQSECNNDQIFKDKHDLTEEINQIEKIDVIIRLSSLDGKLRIDWFKMNIFLKYKLKTVVNKID